MSRGKRLVVGVGERYGKLEVIEEVESRVTPNGTVVRRFKCRCDCGKEKVVGLGSLRNGGTKACGCLQGKHGHGGSHTSEYFTWSGLRARCKDLNNRNYGGRGIKVCARWLESFPAFLEDMGRRPSPEHSIDRIDVNGDYEPRNCRWATAKEQARNTRFNVLVTHNGETLCVGEWAERYGMSCSTLNSRLRNGWLFEAAISHETSDIGFYNRPISGRDKAWYAEYERRGRALSGQVESWTVW